MAIQDFYNLHSGKTCLIIGNGPGLADIPGWFLEMYPSFGTNEIYRRDGFTPTYYTAVDSKVIADHWREISEALPDVPKFIPSRFDALEGEKCVYRFTHRPGPIWHGNQVGRDMLTRPGITYANVTHVALQIAFYMGFDLMLCVGLDNTGDGEHFFGKGKGGNPAEWDEGYKILRGAFLCDTKPRAIINVSTRTKVANLPQKDWSNYAKG